MNDYFERVSLGDIAYFEMGNSPRSEYVSDTPPGVPFLQGNAEFGTHSPAHDRYCRKPSKVSEPGDILLSVRAPVGDVNVSDRAYCIGRGLAAVRFYDLADGFGWHLMRFVAPKLDKYAQGSTFRAVNKTHLENLEVEIPREKGEQRRIADVLDTVDAAIRETDAVIAKQEQVKTGLLQDLLTRGLDAEGRLRDPETNPEAFQEDEKFGLFPKAWRMLPVNELGVWGGGSTPRKSNSDFWGGAVPWVSPKDMGEPAVKRTEDHVTREALSQTNLSVYRPGSVVVVFRSGVLRHTFPVATLNQPFTVNQDMKVLTTQDAVDDRFAFHLLRWMGPLVLRRATKVGTTVESIDTTSFLSLPVGVPALSEQRRIADVLDKVDMDIRERKRVIVKLRYIKTSLTQDLLTGRVRVPDAEEQINDVIE